MSANEMVLFQNDSGLVISDRFAGMTEAIGSDLSGGVSGSYAILAIKGSRFSIKYQGNMTPIVNAQGDPVGSVEMVLVKSNPYLTKQYYPKGFTEGDSSAPDCFSIDGKVPSDAAPHKQHSNCAACPQNTFSKINASTGKKTKPCQDNRKMAIIPLNDLRNELFGGPMLMRIPAASLKDLAMFGDTLKARGFSYNSVAVRISFDLTVSYPKLVFKAIRPLTDEEADVVLELYRSDAVEKLLADFDSPAVPIAEAAPDADDVFEQPPVAAPVVAKAPVVVQPPAVQLVPKVYTQVSAPAPKAPKPAAPAKAPVAAVAPKPPAAKPAPAPVAKPAPVAAPVVAAAQVEEEDTTTEVVPGNLEDDIAGILNELNSIAGA